MVGNSLPCVGREKPSFILDKFIWHNSKFPIILWIVVGSFISYSLNLQFSRRSITISASPNSYSSGAENTCHIFRVAPLIIDCCPALFAFSIKGSVYVCALLPPSLRGTSRCLLACEQEQIQVSVPCTPVSPGELAWEASHLKAL